MDSLQVNGIIRPLEHWVNQFKSSTSENEKELAFLLEQILTGSSFYCYSSGSTGDPKRIRLEINAAKKSAQNTLDFFDLKENNSCYLCLPMTSIAAKMMVIRACLGGLNLCYEEPSLHPNINQNYDFASFSPAQIRNLLKEGKNLKKIKNILIGGAQIPTSIEQSLIQTGLNAFHSYGMTETYSHIALRKLGKKHFSTLPGIKISVSENNCLKISAAYLGSFPIETNDIVEIINETSFTFLGRLDEVINSDGKKIFLKDIEEKLSAHISLPFYLTKKAHDTFGERPVLVIENKCPTKDFYASLKQSFQKVLTKIESPDEIIVKPQFDYTHSGKLLKRE